MREFPIGPGKGVTKVFKKPGGVINDVPRKRLSGTSFE